MAEPEFKSFKELLDASAPLAMSILNMVSTGKQNEALTCLALLGAAAALAKASGCISPEGFTDAADRIYKSVRAEYDVVEEMMN